ncbi:acyl-CoA-binding domain-containing protein 5-like [Leguminivora glycinivorella]|uniref:acyl-CoA-binding domain-containing protein 5-like n=1 Tax=Leguminivora glycinivorella TaxID=1035111 RepID=UPI00200DE583|nr:acyl-CoA-binding domain-containing protein 5-like [Leguminivora glycinivorella]
MSLEEKFNAAVNVIRSLPKSGSYQPSNELMLRFYSYFKQATEGPCDKPKPGFWDVVNRAKWESWNKLGNMSQTEAMQAYVDELHKVPNPSQNQFTEHSLRALYVEKRRHWQNPPRKKDRAGGRRCSTQGPLEHNTPIGSRSVSGASSPVPRARHDSEDEYIDTVDWSQVDADTGQPGGLATVDVNVSDPEVPLRAPAPAQAAPAPAPAPAQTQPRLSNGHAHQITSQLTHLKVLEQLPGTLARLEADVAALRKAVEGERLMNQNHGWRWPWQELSPPTLLLLAAWPFIAYKLAGRFQRRNT